MLVEIIKEMPQECHVQLREEANQCPQLWSEFWGDRPEQPGRQGVGFLCVIMKASWGLSVQY